jgi:hypothetical protein
VKRHKLLFMVAFGVAFGASFAGLRYCEIQRGCDSLGLWYTFYGATISATIITGVLMAAVAVVRFVRRKERADV